MFYFVTEFWLNCLERLISMTYCVSSGTKTLLLSCSLCLSTRIEIGISVNMCKVIVNQVSIFYYNSGPCLTISGLHKVTVVPMRRNGIRQPLICVLVVKSKRCPTLSTSVL